MASKTVKLSEVKAGDMLIADGGFTCIAGNARCEVKQDPEREGEAALYIDCKDGQHFLDGQTGDDFETLIGLTKPVPASRRKTKGRANG